MYSVNNFTQIYGNNIAIDDISFNIEAGNIMGLIGTNGAGKTTIIKASCGLLKPTKGDISIFGRNIKTHRKEYIRNLGAVLEGNRNIYMRLTPEENIEYFARMRNIGKSEYFSRMNILLELFELEHKRKTECISLSRGMQQKVAICCSIIHNPKIIFLDEPTLGLDFESVKIIEKIIKDLGSEDRIIVITSHDLDFISRLVNHVVVIDKGRKVLDSPINELESLKAKDFFEVIIPIGYSLFEDDRIIEIISEMDTIKIRFKIQSPYEAKSIINRFQNNSIPILDMYKSKYELKDLYMDLVKKDKGVVKQ